MKPPQRTVISILAAEHPMPMDAIELCQVMHRRGSLAEQFGESMLLFIQLTGEMVASGDIEPVMEPNILYYALTEKSLGELNTRLGAHGITLERLKSDIRSGLHRQTA